MKLENLISKEDREKLTKLRDEMVTEKIALDAKFISKEFHDMAGDSQMMMWKAFNKLDVMMNFLKKNDAPPKTIRDTNAAMNKLDAAIREFGTKMDKIK